MCNAGKIRKKIGINIGLDSNWTISGSTTLKDVEKQWTKCGQF